MKNFKRLDKSNLSLKECYVTTYIMEDSVTFHIPCHQRNSTNTNYVVMFPVSHVTASWQVQAKPYKVL